MRDPLEAVIMTRRQRLLKQGPPPAGSDAWCKAQRFKAEPRSANAERNPRRYAA
jgi:hypothetical protein